jgi:hypothetical protein
VNPYFFHLPRFGAALALVYSPLSPAEAPSQGLWQYLNGYDANNAALLKNLDVTVGGWAAAGLTVNPDAPANRSNYPVVFNYRANELHLHQLDLFVQKAVDSQRKALQIGGRLDAMFGTDTIFTQATGLDDRLISERDLGVYDLAIPQAYVELMVPVGNGIKAKLGHFYSIYGSESVAAPPNFFYSHSYSMHFEPFTHTGFMLSYAVDPQWEVIGGGVMGWDNFNRDDNNWDFTGGINWKGKQTSVAFAMTSGDSSSSSNQNQSLATLVINHNLSDRLHYTFEHDYGYQEAVSAKPTDWYSILHYLTYDINPDLGVGMRGEWFRDDDGTKNANFPASYYALSLGLQWKPISWLGVHPELRYDWVEAQSHAFADSSKNNQWLIGTNVTVQF